MVIGKKAQTGIATKLIGVFGGTLLVWFFIFGGSVIAISEFVQAVPAPVVIVALVVIFAMILGGKK